MGEVEVECVVVEEEEDFERDVEEVVNDGERSLELEVEEEVVDDEAVKEIFDVVDGIEKEGSVEDSLMVIKDEEVKPVEVIPEVGD